MPFASDESCVSWAQRTFGHADLGDRRRSKRLVWLASAAAASPAGKVTQVCLTDAERQGAYGWIDSDRFSTSSVLWAVCTATVAQSQPHPFVFVPVDQTSLCLTDRQRSKDFGSVGRGHGRRGLQVMTALAVDPDGTPIGLCGQQWWARATHRFRPGQLRQGRRPRTTRSRQQRKDLKQRDRQRAVARRNRQRAFSSKEPFRWVQAAQQVCAAFAHDTNETGVWPWLQCDRGADNQDVLMAFDAMPLWFTVRAKTNRRLDDGTLVQARLAQQPVWTTYVVDVPARAKRPARQATMQVRAALVTLQMRHKGTGHQRQQTLWAVQAEEVNAPLGQRPLRWTLLTNYPVEDEASCALVVAGYVSRWRIEEMHRQWKRGGCRVEDTELRTFERVRRWGTLLAAVATRSSRLAYLAREQPDQSAETEFSQDEIDAAILLRRPPGWLPGQKPSLGQMVRWVADQGGYTGKSSGGPPGATVIGRGLERVKAVAEALATAKQLGMTLVRGM